MVETRVQRRLAAILAADVAGYSRMMGADEEGTLAALTAHRTEAIEPAIASHRGRVVKTTGDGLLAEFASVVDAVRCAVAVQEAMAERNRDVAEDRRIAFRIGVNLGDVLVQEGDVYGEGVNVAARLEGLAEPGGICISGAVHEQVRQRLGLAFEDMGAQRVKNIAEPVRVYRFAPEGADAATRAGTGTHPLFGRPAVAVLPFENLSGDPAEDYFADGLTEDVVTALSLYRSFPVIARNSTFAYKGRSPDVRAVGRDLGARYVIEGSVRRAGARIRVTAQLIDAATGHHAWAERYDRNIEDIFALQDELTRRIAATVVPELEQAEQRRAASRPPQDLDAWMWYVRGTTALYDGTAEAGARARDMFVRALAVDPGYAKAHVGIAFSFGRDLVAGVAASREEAISALTAAAREAVALDRDDSMAQMVMSFAYSWAGQEELAMRTAQRAVALNPNNAIAYGHLGTLLDLAGRHEEGVENLEQGLRLNPKEPMTAFVHMAFLARANLALRRHEEAIAWAQDALAERSDYAPAHYIVAVAAAHLGRVEAARAALDDCERIQPGFVAQRRDWRPYRDQAVNDHILEGLEKAGWPG